MPDEIVTEKPTVKDNPPALDIKKAEHQKKIDEIASKIFPDKTSEDHLTSDKKGNQDLSLDKKVYKFDDVEISDGECL